MRFLLAAVLLATPVQAGPLHWIRTHKNATAAITITCASGALDGFTTRWAEHHCPTCQDQGIFGTRPSVAGAYGQAFIGPAINIGFIFAAQHYDKGGAKFWDWMLTVPIAYHSYADAMDNIGAVNDYESRRLVTRKRIIGKR